MITSFEKAPRDCPDGASGIAARKRLAAAVMTTAKIKNKIMRRSCASLKE
jgi:hypothetical protein